MRNNERGAWGFVSWVAAVLSGALVVMAFFMLATSVKAEDASSTCYFLDMEQISDETVEDTRDALVEQGWYADPTDGKEGLYSPSCLPQGEHEQRALLEELRALREEVDALRQEIRELTASVEAALK
jgi:peptidoglycan hydrolase CwlO-like protein